MRVAARVRSCRGLSLTELLIAISIVGMLASLLLPGLARAREAARRASCQNNLKQFGILFHLYAVESPQQQWPPLQADYAGESNLFGSFALFPRMDSIRGEYLSDLRLLSCPSDPDSLATDALHESAEAALARRPWRRGASYAYLGHVFDKASQPLLRCEALPGFAMLANFPGDGNFGVAQCPVERRVRRGGAQYARARARPRARGRPSRFRRRLATGTAPPRNGRTPWQW